MPSHRGYCRLADWWPRTESFFPTKAQIAIQTGFEVLRHMEAYVTIPNIHRLLLNEVDANAAIETFMNKADQRSHELVIALRDGFFG